MITGLASQGLQCEPHGRDLLGVGQVILIPHVHISNVKLQILHKYSNAVGTITHPARLEAMLLVAIIAATLYLKQLASHLQYHQEQQV